MGPDTAAAPVLADRKGRQGPPAHSVARHVANRSITPIVRSAPNNSAPASDAIAPPSNAATFSAREQRFPILIRSAFTMPMGGAVVNLGKGGASGACAASMDVRGP